MQVEQRDDPVRPAVTRNHYHRSIMTPQRHGAITHMLITSAERMLARLPQAGQEGEAGRIYNRRPTGRGAKI